MGGSIFEIHRVLVRESKYPSCLLPILLELLVGACTKIHMCMHDFNEITPLELLVNKFNDKEKFYVVLVL
jgi:hypothetical protein